MWLLWLKWHLFVDGAHALCTAQAHPSFMGKGSSKLAGFMHGSLGSIALLSHNTLNWSAILGLSTLSGTDPCYGVQAYLVNFALHFQIVNTLALCQSKAM